MPGIASAEKWFWSIVLLCTAGFSSLFTSSGVTAEPVAAKASPLSPQDSLQAFQLDPSLTIELVAAEPEVVDPVAVQFGADGSLWVVEMRDYPYGPKDGGKPLSQIRRLRDTDGDGRFETATTFADGLLFVTGILPYRDGLIATIAGEILFLADRDGDGVADVRETWFRGFAQENSQLRANHPTLGLDGFVYVANGLRGGKILAVRPDWKKTDEPLVISGFDFRFHPVTGEFSTVTGHGQFGLTFDDYGREFVCSNRNPCQHVVLDDRYLKQNPRFAVRQVMHDVCAPGEFSTLFPVSKAWTTSTLHANQFTAACGVMMYRGSALPADFYGNAFTCDPTGNLVHREIVTPAGGTFAGRSPYEHKEFLASTDTWFRPVNLSHGPDGALYVVDMYRAVIEHPDWMPDELKTRADLMLGIDRGRIYRVKAKAGAPALPAIDLSTLSPLQLVEQLASPNSFQRDTAWERLQEQKSDELVAAVRKFVTSAPLPVTRALALRLLGVWKAVTVDDVRVALSDAAGPVQETALILSEALPERDSLRGLILERAKSSDARVRLQALLTSSLLPAEADLVATLLPAGLAEESDIWLQAAILTTARGQSLSLLVESLKAAAQQGKAGPGLIALCRQLATVAATTEFDAQRPQVWHALAGLSTAAGNESLWNLRWQTVNALAEALRRRGVSLAGSSEVPQAVQPQLQTWLEQASTVAANTEQDAAVRQVAIQSLRWNPEASTADVLLKLALNDPDGDVQQAAFEVLSASPADHISETLLEQFGAAAPRVRRGILEVLMSNPKRIAALLEAMEAGTIKATEIDPVRSQQLTNHRDTALRDRARKILEAATAERGAVLTSYAGALKLTADPKRGKQIFEKQCVTCHRVGEMGVNVGPDIADSRTKTPEMLLTSILDPNRAVDNNFFGYTVLTNNGKVLSGIIAAETTSSITLRQPEGKMETLLRTDIDELRNTGMSLMPVGFEKTIPPQEMADLVSFLKNWRYLDGEVPLSENR